MGWFRRSTQDPAELERLKSEVQVLRNAVEAHDRRRREAERAAATQPPPEPEPVSDVEARARLDEFAARLAALDERANAAPPPPPPPSSSNDDEARARLDELASKLADLDARVSAVSTELANQVTELGSDIESLAAREPAAGGADEVVIGELRDGQNRLANEQARYQIAFREDLARLAEQVRRPGQSAADSRS